jgi:hypothetical protein
MGIKFQIFILQSSVYRQRRDRDVIEKQINEINVLKIEGKGSKSKILESHSHSNEVSYMYRTYN